MGNSLIGPQNVQHRVEHLVCSGDLPSRGARSYGSVHRVVGIRGVKHRISIKPSNPIPV